MSERFQVEKLPDVDQQMIKRGRCPWCIDYRLVDDGQNDVCPECGDVFIGKLTIED